MSAFEHDRQHLQLFEASGAYHGARHLLQSLRQKIIGNFIGRRFKLVRLQSAMRLDSKRG
jgi:hypothetical protein